LFQEGVHQRAHVRLHEYHDPVQGSAWLLVVGRRRRRGDGPVRRAHVPAARRPLSTSQPDRLRVCVPAWIQRTAMRRRSVYHSSRAIYRLHWGAIWGLAGARFGVKMSTRLRQISASSVQRWGFTPPPFLNPLKILAGPDWLGMIHYSHCGNEVRLTLPVAVCLFSLCSLYTQLLKTRQKTCGDSVDNSVEENSSVFSVIRMRWLPSAARACGQ